MRDLFRIAVAAERGAALGVDRLVLFGDPLGDCGADRARADAVHRDALAAEFDGERAGQAGDAALGRGIGAVRCGSAERLGGGDVNDSRTFRFAQIRQRGADDARMRGQHHGQRFRPRVLVSCIVDRGAQRQPGIVDDDVEATELRGNVVDDGGDAVGAGHVERPGLGLATRCNDRIGNGLGAVGGDIGDSDIGAFGREHMRGGATHAAGGAGDENGQALDRAAELAEI